MHCTPSCTKDLKKIVNRAEVIIFDKILFWQHNFTVMNIRIHPI